MPRVSRTQTQTNTQPNMHSTHNPLPITHHPAAEKHTFASRERDTETGLNYFGARYYSSDLSIWLSVDPMADKYPSMSPYTYCANNPVKLVDPNGEDYEVVVDDKAMTITIKANFYVTKDEKCVLDAGLKTWNSESGNFSYIVGEGENAKSYTIQFDLQSIECDSKEEVTLKASSDKCGNSFSIEDKVKDDYKPIRGAYKNGAIRVSNEFQMSDLLHSSSHEPGHAIGIGDMRDGGLMESGGDGYSIRANYVASSLRFAGFNCIGPQDIVTPLGGCEVSVSGKMPNQPGVVKRK